MLTAQDIRGIYVLPPTPCKEGAGGWDAVDTVDLDETARMTELIIQPGVGGIALGGTTGEGHSLLWEEKRDLVDTVVQVSRKRVQVFGPATALGTREVIRQMRGLRDVGADGAFLGLPLWQTPTLENSVQFFADLSEALPDMAIMIYSNARFFKSTFGPDFWAGVAKRAPTVITTKIAHGYDHYLENLEAVGDRINLLPGERAVFRAYEMVGTRVTAVWSTQATMGPEPMVALLEAIQRNDKQRVEEIRQDFNSVPHFVPAGGARGHDPTDGFSQYNVQAEKWRFNASGVVRAGPCRPPYYDLPEDWKQQAELEAKLFLQLRQKYVQEAVSS
jgi:trans-o-hydroxybenzylidenepyruvate hydratase-aldolase